VSEVPLERSERELRAARLLLEQELFDEALPLAYQAAEDAARVALEANGLESAKTHAATIARFGELLMSKGAETGAGRALNASPGVVNRSCTTGSRQPRMMRATRLFGPNRSLPRRDPSSQRGRRNQVCV